MIDVKEETNIHIQDFERLESSPAAGGPSWLRPIRKAAIARFGELGYPTVRDEEWRYTNVAPIARGDFRVVEGNGRAITRSELDEILVWDADCFRSVFVNGHYAEDLSSSAAAPNGVRIAGLVEAIDDEVPEVEAHLARHAAYADDAFVALNTALWTDGGFIHVTAGSVVETPIHVVYVSTAQEQPSATYPRTLVLAGENSQATIVETHVAVGDGAYLTNAVTEIVAEAGSNIDHYRLQDEAPSAYHVSCLHLHQHRDSTVSSQTIPLEGALIRNNVNTLLDAEGCDCTLGGLYVLNGRRHVDNHLRVEHAKPNCNSREFFKGVLDDQSRGVFCGRIVVNKDAQKTDAKQTNMNLLLSEDARVDTKPQLEIFADDVRCTHGATIGQIDEDALFYLRSRGVHEDAARSLLIYAFARESTDAVRVDPLRQHLERWLLDRLPQGQLLKENA